MIQMAVKTTKKLNAGTDIPVIGFGTWQIPEGEDAFKATSVAIHAGYRLIDTAAIYGNEGSVGRAIQECRIPRSELFITTKLWNAKQGYDSAKEAFEISRQKLGLEYIDLYLIHWPTGNESLRHDSWRAMKELLQEKKVHSIGVSNFTVEHLEALDKVSNVTPAVNQIELRPYNFEQQQDVLAYCQDKGIVVEADSPLVRGEKLSDQIVDEIAKRHNKTSAQVLLRWSLHHRAVPIPKSTSPNHIRANLDIFNFELDEKDMRALDRLSSGYSALH